MKVITHKMFKEKHKGEKFERPERLMHLDFPDSDIQNGEKYIGLAHSAEYLTRCRESCTRSLDFGETETSPETYELACYAVGASVMAAQMALDDNRRIGGFALIRPPGHHASRNLPQKKELGLGFCLFNNMAIAALNLLKQKLKILVLDFDLHHGNGTQEILRRRKNAIFVSTHQKGIWPMPYVDTETSYENYVNITFPTQCTDDEYLSALERKILPLLRDFKPDVVGLSAGFDGYCKDFNILEGDEGFRLTTKTYSRIKEIISDFRHFAVLEGGYNPESLRDCVPMFLD